MFISVKELEIDDRYYPRHQCSWRDVLRYRDALKAGAIFKPIVVAKDKKRKFVLDGRMRYQAHLELGKPKIAATFTTIKKELWFAEAVRLNVQNGVPLNLQERLEAAHKLHAQQLAPEFIERALAITNEDLERMMAQRGVHMDSPDDWERVIIKAPLVPLAIQNGKEWMRQESSRIQEGQRLVASGSSLHMVNQVTDMLQQGFFTEDDSVREAIEELYAAAGSWLSKREMAQV